MEYTWSVAVVEMGTDITPTGSASLHLDVMAPDRDAAHAKAIDLAKKLKLHTPIVKSLCVLTCID